MYIYLQCVFSDHVFWPYLLFYDIVQLFLMGLPFYIISSGYHRHVTFNDLRQLLIACFLVINVS